MHLDVIKCLNACVVYCPKVSIWPANTARTALQVSSQVITKLAYACLSIKWGGQAQGSQPHQAPSNGILYTTIIVFPVCLQDFKGKRSRITGKPVGWHHPYANRRPKSKPANLLVAPLKFLALRSLLSFEFNGTSSWNAIRSMVHTNPTVWPPGIFLWNFLICMTFSNAMNILSHCRDAIDHSLSCYWPSFWCTF